MRVLILGGTGPLGRALVKHLRQAKPAVHIALVSRSQFAIPGASEVIAGDQAALLPSPGFARTLESFDAVVHLGDGLGMLQRGEGAHMTREADRLVAASEAIARAVAAARVPLFAYISSIKAVCDENDDRILADDCEPRPTTLYGRSKLRLERDIAAALKSSGTRLVIIRNPVTYGDAGSGSMNRLIALADTPLPLPFGGLTNRRSMLAVRNFASALAAVVQTGPGPAGVFHVQDGPPLTMTEIFEALRAALGRPRRLFPAGTHPARLAQHLPLVGPLARRLYGSLELSDERFRSSFKWTPEIGSSAALAETARCHRDRSSASVGSALC